MQRFLIVLLVIALLSPSPATAAEETPPSVLDRRVTVTFVNIPVREAFRTIAKLSSTSIAIDPTLTGSVNGTFEKAELREVLNTITQQVNAGYRDLKGMIYVSRSGRLRASAHRTPQRPGTTLPYFGEQPQAIRAFGEKPPGAHPKKPPYFGQRQPTMPQLHFMDPKLPDDHKEK